MPDHPTRSPRQLVRPSVRRPDPPSAAPRDDETASAADAVVDCALYVDGERVTGDLPAEGALEAARAAGGFVWIGLHRPSDAQVQALAREFDLHPLAVEDAVHAHQRPKVERYGDTLFAVIKTARYIEHENLTWQSEVIETGEIMVFLGERFVITVRHGEPGPLQPVRLSLEARPDLLALGPAAVLWRVADHAVDQYLEVAEQLEDDVDEVEAQVFSPRRGDDSERVYQLKREVLEFKRAVVPLTRPLADLVRADEMSEVDEYLRDVADHLARVTEQVESYDELLNAILDVNLTRVSVQQNNDMRKISAWVAIAAVPTMLAGIEGMNFDHMPELHLLLGYPAILIVMVLSTVLLFRGFKRNGWL